MDVFEPGTGSQPQIHDLNPTTFPPTGLFWTLAIPDDSIQVNPGKGSALMVANNIPILDYHDIPNALFGGGPAPMPGTVSFTIAWNGVNERVNLKNRDPIYGGFAGEFVRNNAQMAWTATVGDYHFVSDPLGTSASAFAEIGKERNGVFFR
jgi:hypothetical protein